MQDYDYQFKAIDNVKRVVDAAKEKGVDVLKEAWWLVDKCRYGDIYGRISWKKLLYNVKDASDIKRYYGLFH